MNCEKLIREKKQLKMQEQEYQRVNQQSRALLIFLRVLGVLRVRRARGGQGSREDGGQEDRARRGGREDRRQEGPRKERAGGRAGDGGKSRREGRRTEEEGEEGRKERKEGRGNSKEIENPSCTLSLLLLPPFLWRRSSARGG